MRSKYSDSKDREGASATGSVVSGASTTADVSGASATGITIKKLINDFTGIFYPPLCSACGEVLMQNEKVLCLSCMADLPRTGFHNDPENEVAKMFWGRVNIKNATAFMVFVKESRYRQILHDIKYRGNYEAAAELGRMFGNELISSPFSAADVIIPVPLHAAKQRKRGYNQSAIIAEGMTKSLNMPVEAKLIKRLVNTGTQTSRTRYERWENVKGTFEVTSPEKLVNRHVLLVDDVITTGSTFEACASAIIAIPGTQVSVAALAYVKLL